MEEQLKRGRGRPPKSKSQTSPTVDENADGLPESVATAAPTQDEDADASVSASMPSDADVTLARAEEMLADIEAQLVEVGASIEEHSALVRDLDSKRRQEIAEFTVQRQHREELANRISRARIALSVVKGTNAEGPALDRLDALDRDHAELDQAIVTWERDSAAREGDDVAQLASIRTSLDAAFKRRAALLETRDAIESAKAEARARKVAEVRAQCEEFVADAEAAEAAAHSEAHRRSNATLEARSLATRVLASYPELTELAKQYAAAPPETPVGALLAAHEHLLETYTRVAGEVSPDKLLDVIPGRPYERSQVLADFLALSTGDIRRLLTITAAEREDSNMWHEPEAQRFAREKLAAFAALRLHWRLQPKSQLPLSGGWFSTSTRS